MTWKRYTMTKGRGVKGKENTITISVQGYGRFGSDLREEFEECEYVDILFDKERGKVALVPYSGERKLGSTKITRAEDGTILVSLSGLFTDLGITKQRLKKKDLGERRVEPEREEIDGEKALVLDVSHLQEEAGK